MSTKEHELHSELNKAASLLESVRKTKSAVDTDFKALYSNASIELGNVEQSLNNFVNIESLPGARTPKWYTVDIDFQAGETQSKSRAFEISSEGAFVVSTMQTFYKITDEVVENYVEGSDYISGASSYTTPSGRYLPTTTFPILAEGCFKNLSYSAATTPSANNEPPFGNELYEFPEFSFIFEVETASQRWTNRPIPASALYTTEHPLHFGETCYLDRTERLMVTARPDARVPLSGVLRLVMHGYQVLGPIDPAKLRRYR